MAEPKYVVEYVGGEKILNPISNYSNTGVKQSDSGAVYKSTGKLVNGGDNRSSASSSSRGISSSFWNNHDRHNGTAGAPIATKNNLTEALKKYDGVSTAVLNNGNEVAGEAERTTPSLTESEQHMSELLSSLSTKELKKSGKDTGNVERAVGDIRALGGADYGESHGTGKFFKNIGKAGVEESASGYTGFLRTIFEGGQNARTQQNEDLAKQAQADVDKYSAMVAEEKAAGNDYEYAQNLLDDAKRRLEAYGGATETQQKASKATSDLANQLQENANKVKAETKADLGNTKLGNVVTDVGTAAVGMLIDAAVGSIFGLGAGSTADGLAAGEAKAAKRALNSVGTRANLGARVWGSAAQEAEASGASVNQQNAYGAARAIVSIATESIGDGLAGIYGKGATDDIVEAFLKKVAERGGNDAALRIAIDAAGEGGEEILEDFLTPFTQLIYDKGKALKDKYGSGWKNHLNALADDLYDGLIGAILGAAGGSVSAVSKANAQADANVQTNPILAQTEQTAQTETPVQNNLLANPQTQTEITAETASTENGSVMPNNETNATGGINTPETTQTSENVPNELLNLKSQVDQQGNLQVNPEEVFTSGDNAVTQNRYAETNLSPEAYAASGGVTEHLVHHDAEVDAKVAELIATDRIGLEQKILNDPEFCKTDIGIRSADTLITDIASELSNAQTTADQTAIGERLANLRTARENSLGEAARAMRQAGRGVGDFATSPADIVSDAAQQLYGKKSDVRRNVTPEKKAEILGNVTEMADRLSAIKYGDTESTISLIHDVASIRNSYGRGKIGEVNRAIIDDALHRVADLENGANFLKDLATTQTRSIAGDYTRIKPLDFIKGIRYLNALSAPKTSGTNVGANTIFGEAIAKWNNNFAIPFDMLFSAVSGQRTIAFDRGVFSGDTWSGAYEATLKSFVEVSLDAESEQATYAYNEIKGSTFKMTGNWFERYLAKVSKYQGYALKTTDQMAKGGESAEVERGLKALNEKRSEAGKGTLTEEQISEFGTEEAKYRTLQTDSVVSKRLIELKNWANKVAHIGNEKTGTFGIGDHFIMFAQVPANQVATQLEMQPAVGGVLALANTVNLAQQAIDGNVDVETQRKTAQAWGKVLTGSAMVGSSFLLSMLGILRCVDEDDDDYAAMLKAQGKYGTQLNISALGRILTGDTLPRETDTWLSLNWIPQYNALAITGNALYQSKIDDGTIDLGEAYMAVLTGLKDSLKDFPAVSGVTSTIKSAKYAKYEGDDRSELDEDTLASLDFAAKIGAVAGNELGNLVGGILIPNFEAAIASGTDSVERDTYSSNNPLIRATDMLKSKVVGLRETLEPRLDAFGDVITNEGGWRQFANKFARPGALTSDRTTENQKFVDDMVAATGTKSIVPDRKAPSSIKVGDGSDAKSLHLSQEERAQWQKTYGGMVTDLYSYARESEEFNALSPEAQAEVLKEYLSAAKTFADNEFREGRGATTKTNGITDLLTGKDMYNDNKDTPPLDPKNLGEYVVFDKAFKSAMDSENGYVMKKVLRGWDNLDANTQAVAVKRESKINDLLLWSTYTGDDVELDDYFKIAALDDQAREHFQKDSGSGLTKMWALSQANIPDTAKEAIIGNNLLGLSKSLLSVYDVMSTDWGMSLEETADWFYNADFTESEKYLVDNLVALGLKSPSTATKRLAQDVKNMDRRGEDISAEITDELYSQLEKQGYDMSQIYADTNGTLSNFEAIVGLQNSDRFPTRSARASAYRKLFNVLSNYYNNWYSNSYTKEDRYLNNSVNNGNSYGRQNEATFWEKLNNK